MKTREEQINFLNANKLNGFLKFLAVRYSVYVPRKFNGELQYELFVPGKSGEGELVIGEIRPAVPVKSFFFPAAEKVGTYFPAQADEEGKGIAIVGMKSCDLDAIKLFDLMYREGEFSDPVYAAWREKVLIVAADCTGFIETCFCRLVDVSPYPRAGFDLVLSPVKDGFVVEAGTEKGGQVIKEGSGLFTTAGPEQMREREEKRGQLTAAVDENVKPYRLKTERRALLRKQHASPVWKETTRTCVECGACVLTCPNCYCFLLSDEVREGKFERIRAWDTCQYTGFARVAGGANPRRRLHERLRHRYLHKFDFLKENFGFYACTGCGRCILACMGKIDMRKVFRELDKGSS